MKFIKTYYDEKGIVRIDDDSFEDLKSCLDEKFFEYFGKNSSEEFIKNSIEFLKNYAKEYWIDNPKAFGLEFEGNNGELLNFQFSNPVRKISMSNNGVK
jgi:hypothetical protein